MEHPSNGSVQNDWPACDGEECQPSSELSMLSQPYTVSLLDPAALSSQDPRLCDVFSCLFCEHVSLAEVSLSLHVAEVHKCRSLFLCTECDYQCSVRELFVTHVSSHLCEPCGVVKNHKSTGGLAQDVIVKDEIQEDPESEQPNAVDDIVSPVENKARTSRRKMKGRAFNKLMAKSSLSHKSLRESDQHKNDEVSSSPNISKNLTLKVKDANLPDNSHSKKSIAKYETIEDLMKALRITPKVIVDVYSNSFPDCKEFMCFLCGFLTKKFRYFKDHFMKHYDLTPFVCKLCNAAFVNQQRLKVHLRNVHAQERTFLCSHCPYAAKSHECLKKHVLLMHPCDEDLKYPCPDCHMKFAVYHKLLDHMYKAHNSQKKFVCDLCNFSSNYTQTFKSHMNRHLGLLYLCSVCGNAYHSKYYLTRHQRTHDRANIFQCDQCPFQCKRKEGLRLHMKVHTNERPYQCSLCKYRAKTSCGIQQHMKKHLSIRKYSCTLCDKSFKHKHHLERHLEQHSSIALSCHLCDYQGPSTASYQRHMLLHDPARRWNCSLCKRYFATSGELGHHVKKVHTVRSAAIENEHIQSF